MSELIYWGQAGQYGPFTIQADGWPHAGEVVRHYRKHANLSASDVAQRYSQATGTPVAATWILDMESKNKVPTDMLRRRALADLLHIPPVLLGLASLEQVVLSANEPAPSAPAAPPVLTRAAVGEADLFSYEQRLRLLWLVYQTSSAYTILAEVSIAVQEVEQLRQQVKGSLLARIQSLLYQHYRLAAEVYRDQGQYQQAYDAASHAITLAIELEQREWLAPALYARGHIYLVWGTLGEQTSQGLLTLDYRKVLLAINDLQAGLAVARRRQLQGLISSELGRAHALFAVRQGNVVYPTSVTEALSQSKAAEEFIGRGSRQEPYLQWLLSGKVVSDGGYFLNKAITYHLLGRPEQAEQILTDEFEQAIPRTQTRQTAWMQIVRAQVALKQRDFLTATSMATSACRACRDIHSVGNLALINDIHTHLQEVKSASVDQQSVYELGVMLTKYYLSSARIV